MIIIDYFRFPLKRVSALHTGTNGVACVGRGVHKDTRNKIKKGIPEYKNFASTATALSMRLFEKYFSPQRLLLKGNVWASMRGIALSCKKTFCLFKAYFMPK